jgi:hypothetical protein
VAGGVPVLGHHHVLMITNELVDLRHDPVALRHRKRAAGAEIVLHIHDDKNLHDFLRLGS